MFLEQRQCNTSQVEIHFFGWGERKGITNPWIKSADKFKPKRNGGNHLESHNSFEETAWPNFRQNDPLEILRDMECQASHFRKIFKQGPVPVSDSVSHRFCVYWVFFHLKMLGHRQSVESCSRNGRNWEISSLQLSVDFSVGRSCTFLKNVML